MIYVLLTIVGALSAFLSLLLSSMEPSRPGYHDGTGGFALFPDLLLVPAFWCLVAWSLETFCLEGGARGTLVFLLVWNGAKFVLYRVKMRRYRAFLARRSVDLHE